MIPSPWLYDFLKRFERFRPTAYLPTPRDKWTIGWGHTLSVKEGDTCTMNQASEWLQQDVVTSAVAVNKCVTVPLTQNQYDALVSLTFNIGVSAFEESTLLRKLNDRNYWGAADEFLRWDHQGNEVLSGLLSRRQAERAHFVVPPD